MILRYLLQDNAEMAEHIKCILKNEKVLILPEVIAEVIYVMVKVYKYDRILTAEGVLRFLKLRAVVTEHPDVMRKGTELYRDTGLDFVDCLLCAYHVQEHYEISTFDKKLNRQIERETEKIKIKQ